MILYNGDLYFSIIIKFILTNTDNAYIYIIYNICGGIMLCNNGRLSHNNKTPCKFYFGRSYLFNDELIEEHYCNSGFIAEIAETSEEYHLVNLTNKQVRTCNLYIPLKKKKKKKKKNKKDNKIKSGAVNGK